MTFFGVVLDHVVMALMGCTLLLLGFIYHKFENMWYQCILPYAH